MSLDKEAATGNGGPRIGVYICHCATNIAGTIDIECVAAYASGLPGVELVLAVPAREDLPGCHR